MPNLSEGLLAAAGRRALNPARVADELVSGSIISGRFRLQQLLGRGGMASVWRARHLTLDTDVAIKFLEPRWSGSTEVRSRFAREATAIARIRSAHIVQVLDYGFTEGGRGFIVMELLQGEDLGRRLARTPKLEMADARRIVGQACRGLGKAHAAHIIHRDIKPENLFLVADEEGFFVKLLDFGVAKAVGVTGDATHQTDTGQLVGTPLYMSPEQALGRSVDDRCDLYSLATVAYRCLTGRPPFIERHVGELLVALSTAVPPAPSVFEPSLPSSLDAWFASMFAKDPNARCCQTVRELAASFEEACAGIAPSTQALAATTHVSAEAATQPGDADGRPVSHGATPAGDLTPSPAPERPPRDSARAGSRRAWVALILLAALLGLAFVVWEREPRTLSGSTERAARSLQPMGAGGAHTSAGAAAIGASTSAMGERQLRADASAGSDGAAVEEGAGGAAGADEAAGAPQRASVSDGPPAKRGALPNISPKASGARAGGGAVAGKKKVPIGPAERGRAQPDGASPVQSPAADDRPARKRPLELDRSLPWGKP
jgi:hypothetical protein